ncbi:MAG: acyl--CoA ligase [Actinobacteria bacterium]|nr:MAG: acyl--CoA ligase [Actinomycetota bacterium]
MLGEVVREAARRFGDTVAQVAASGWEVTYADLDRLSDEVAAGFRTRGLREGDVVALVLPSVPEYAIAYLGAAKAGLVTAGVNPRLSATERDAVLSVADPRLVLATAELAPRAGDIVEVTPAAHGDSALAGVRARGETVPDLPDDPDRPVAIIFTSGTTGAPKGAVFGVRQLRAITAIDVGDRWGGGGRSLWGTALSHLGFMTKFAGNLRQGGTAHLTLRWRADEHLRFIAEHRMGYVSGIPTQVALMLRVPDLDHYDLSCVKAIVMGGGPATPALVREARARFAAPLSVRYSCTEAGIGVGTSFDDPDEDAEVSVGRPLPGVELALRDADDRPVAAGEIGAVCLRSPAVMTGYYRDPEASTAAFTADGFVRTGDLGRLDEQGRLHLAGRTKEMYVRGGYNVYPFEVESVLSQHPDVAAVAVVPLDDPVMGEVGVAFVVPRRRDKPPALAELRRFGQDRLAAYKLPERVVAVDELPLTAGEKVDRRALAEIVASEP